METYLVSMGFPDGTKSNRRFANESDARKFKKYMLESLSDVEIVLYKLVRIDDEQ